MKAKKFISNIWCLKATVSKILLKFEVKLVREEEPSKIPEIVEVKTPFSEPDTPIGDITH